jgi:hypothetical protein
MSYNYGLVGINNTQESTLSTILLDNLINFYDWGLLNKGGFETVKIPSSGMYGGNKHILKAVQDPNYTNGQVWQSFKENWVWESGLSTTTQPVQISGIFVDNIFKPYGYNSSIKKYTGSGYTINYNEGKIIFDTPIATTSTVSLNHSYKWIKVDQAEGIPFFREIQTNSFRLDKYFLTGSGDWVQLGQTRIQLPAVLIEVVPNCKFRGYQLGGGQWADSDIVFYVLANNYTITNDIMNIIAYQNDRTLRLYSTTAVANSGHLPLDYKNELVSKSYNYPFQIDNHYFKNCFITNTNINNVTQFSPDLYMGTVRCSTEVEMISLS